MITNGKVGVIGCGHWGPNHVRVFANFLGGKNIIAVDADPERLARVRTLFRDDVAGELDYHTVLADPTVSAVVIATPTSTHYKLVYEALMAGKHVLCEKPLCQTLAEGQDLVSLARARGKVLMVGHVFLFNGGIVKVRELAKNGEVGDLRYASIIRANLGPIRSDVNVIHDLASHDVAILNWVFDDEPECVWAMGSAFLQPGIEDVAFVSLKYRRRGIAGIVVSWLSPRKVRQMTVVGSKKMVLWDDLDIANPVAIYDKGANADEYAEYGEFLRISTWDRDVRLPKVHIEEPLKIQNRYFLECIERGAVETSSAEFAVGVVKVLEAVQKSLRSQGCRVAIN